MARPIATRWRCPPESCAGLRLRRSSSSRVRAASATRVLDLLAGPTGQLQREADVPGHGHVRVQGVVLEHHRHVPFAWRQVVDDLVADHQRAVGDVLEPGHHAQRGGLAASRRADEHQQLAVGDVDREVLEPDVTVRVDLGEVLHLHRRHEIT